MSAPLDVLIPTCDRTAALAVTLTSLCGQTFRDFRVVISDQGEKTDAGAAGEVRGVIRLLEAHGHVVETFKHLPRRGMAEQRQFLLDCATAPYVLFLDDDVVLETDLLERMLGALREEGCGFLGSAVHGLSFLKDVRPHQQTIELWNGPVRPEIVRPGTDLWQRHRLHNAANLFHVQERLGLTPAGQRKYRVAWVGACVLYDAAKLRQAGGFEFWTQLPAEHCGEDVLAQLRVMARFGGCGLIPSGAYHLELPTTIEDRRINAPEALGLGLEQDGVPGMLPETPATACLAPGTA
jgi:GT2 family glycosyltransferase